MPVSPPSPDFPIAFSTLYESPLVAVRDYKCGMDHSAPGAEEESGEDTITLMRHGAFCRHFGKRSVTANVNQATFFAKNSIYRVSHPTDCGDRGTVFEINQRVLRDMVRELDPAVAERDGSVFPFPTGPCDSGIFWRHRELVQTLEAGGPLEHLWADVTALQIIADVLEAAFDQYGNPAKPRRETTGDDHFQRTEAAKIYLAANLGEAVTLETVAAAVNSSPFNFARIFQQQAGVPVHRYLTLLRLRASLERLADGADDITELALDLGFSSHSHFTDVFRKEFGKTPSEIRRGALGKMSKNLIV
jgi:AraC family transcriptional regulator